MKSANNFFCALTGLLLVEALNSLAVFITNGLLLAVVKTANDRLMHTSGGLDVLLRLSGVNERGDHLFKHALILYESALRRNANSHSTINMPDCIIHI